MGGILHHDKLQLNTVMADVGVVGEGVVRRREAMQVLACPCEDVDVLPPGQIAVPPHAASHEIGHACRVSVRLCVLQSDDGDDIPADVLLKVLLRCEQASSSAGKVVKAIPPGRVVLAGGLARQAVSAAHLDGPVIGKVGARGWVAVNVPDVDVGCGVLGKTRSVLDIFLEPKGRRTFATIAYR